MTPEPSEIVLILGNGLSRLAFDAAIRAHTGPVWGCNAIYLDYGDKLDRIAGHDWCMADAARVREEKGYTYKILGGLKWSGDIGDEAFTCKPIFRENTGTTMVAEALTRGHNVIACGFDMGGPDVYSPDHEKRNKTVWVTRWRLIFEEFGSDRVTFWGYDHKPFLLQKGNAREYSKKYMAGEVHIPDPAYAQAVAEWDNDYSRILARVPKARFKNIGNREWYFEEIPGVFRGGAEVIIPEELARKHEKEYPKEFSVEPFINELA